MEHCHQNLIKKIFPSVGEKYCPEGDSEELKTRQGTQRWSLGLEWTQHYCGTFLCGNLHGEGTYKWLKIPDKKKTFEGNFYANSLEGYGVMSYDDKNVFEGLYRKNLPFGPGILTYANGTQDVGLWDNKNLVRLCCFVYSDWIPKLGKTNIGRTKLLGYRSIISVDVPRYDIAKDILTKLNAGKDVSDKSNELYSPFIRNPNSKFFNKPLYDENFYGTQDLVIEVAKSSDELSLILSKRRSSAISDWIFSVNESTSCGLRPSQTVRSLSITKPVRITELLAWNNGDLSIEMLKHTFLNRKTEKNVSFKIYKLLCGNRRDFHPAGEQEYACIEFLKSCSEGNHELASTLFRTYRINPDVCDSRGNSGIIYAAARDRLRIIKLLSGFAANIDCYNDEGLTALTMCLCRYIALMYNVIDWEKAFLHDITPLDEEVKPGYYAYPHESPHVTYPHESHTVSKFSFLETVHDYNNATLTNMDEILQQIHPKEENGTPVMSKMSIALKKCEECQSLKNSQIKLLKAESNLYNILPSFAVIISIIDELASNGDPEAQEFKKKIEKEILERIQLKEQMDVMDFSNFQEPYVYVSQEGMLQKYLFHEEYVVPPKPHKKKAKKERKGKKGAKKVHKKDSKELKRGKASKSKKGTSQSSVKGKKSKKGSSKSSLKGKKSKTKLKKEKEPVAEPEPVETEEMILERIKQQKLEVVAKTIWALLKVGTDVNLGDVPIHVLLLATYAKHVPIFRAIVEKAEDLNVTTCTENLSAFHILASFPQPTADTVAMCEELAAHGADPNLRANQQHWSAQKDQILTKVQDPDDAGKTALQLLCMRQDFPLCDENLEAMCRALLSAGCDPNSLYLGHTALTLALIKGNLRLMETLLQSGLTDPNQILGLNMGSPMTVLLLKRYKNILPLEESQAACELLAKYYVNPLNSTGEHGNAIEFDIAEYTVPVKHKKGKVKKGKDKKGKGKKGKDKKSHKSSKTSTSKSSKKGSKKSKKGKVSTQDVLRKFMIDTARSILMKRAEGIILKYLYDVMLYSIYNEEDQPKQIAKMLTVKKARRHLQILITEGEIKNPRRSICYMVLKFIEKYGSKSDVGSKEVVMPIKEMLQDLYFSLKPLGEYSKYFVDPMADPDSDKYNVCFECLTQQDKRLIACPVCEQIQFCSQECNKHNNKHKPRLHNCGLLFYNSERHAQDAREAKGEPRVKSAIAGIMVKMERLKEEREQMLDERNKYEQKLKLGLIPNAKKILDNIRRAKLQEKNGEYVDSVYYPGIGKAGILKHARKIVSNYSWDVDSDLNPIKSKRRTRGGNRGRAATNSSKSSKSTAGKKGSSSYASSSERIHGKSHEKRKHKYTSGESEDGAIKGKHMGRMGAKVGKRGLTSGSEASHSGHGGSKQRGDKKKCGKNAVSSESDNNVLSSKGGRGHPKKKAWSGSGTVSSEHHGSDKFGKRRHKPALARSSEIRKAGATRSKMSKGTSEFDSNDSLHENGKGHARKGKDGKDKPVSDKHKHKQGTGKTNKLRASYSHYESGVPVAQGKMHKGSHDGYQRTNDAKKSGASGTSDDNVEKDKAEKHIGKAKKKTEERHRSKRREITDSGSESDSPTNRHEARKQIAKGTEKTKGAKKKTSRSSVTSDDEGKQLIGKAKSPKKDVTRKPVGKAPKGGSKPAFSDDDEERVGGKSTKRRKVKRTSFSSESVATTKEGRAKKRDGKAHVNISGSAKKSPVNNSQQSPRTTTYGSSVNTDTPRTFASRRTDTQQRSEHFFHGAKRPPPAFKPREQVMPPMGRQDPKRLPLRFQHFMQNFAAYFENFDWLNVMLPYVVYYKDQLYYKFCQDEDIFVGTYYSAT